MTEGADTPETPHPPSGVELKRYFIGETYPQFWIAKVRERKEIHSHALRIFLEGLDITHTGQLLELGAGEGSVALEVRKRGTTYVGIDISKRMLLSAQGLIHSQGKAANSRTELVQGDVEDLPFKDGSFSRVGSFASFFFFPNQRRAIRELARVCAPGGLIAIEHRNLLAPGIQKAKLTFWVRYLTAIVIGHLHSIRMPLGAALTTLISRVARFLYGFRLPVQPFYPTSLPHLLAALRAHRFHIVNCYGYTIDYNRQPVVVQGIRSLFLPGIIVIARKYTA